MFCKLPNKYLFRFFAVYKNKHLLAINVSHRIYLKHRPILCKVLIDQFSARFNRTFFNCSVQ